MNAYSAQGSGKGHFLANNRKCRAGASFSNEPDISGNIDSGRASPVTGIGRFDSFHVPDAITNSHTSFAHYAEVVITDKERIVFTDREIPGKVFGHFIDPDVVDCILQFTTTVLGAEYASFGNIHVTQTDVERSATFTPVTDKAFMRMPDKNTLEGFSPKCLYLRCIGRYRHTFRNLCITRQHCFTVCFNQAELTRHIGHYFRQRSNTLKMAKAGNIYPGLLTHIHYGLISFGRNLFTIYYNPGCCHPFFSLSTGNSMKHKNGIYYTIYFKNTYVG
jgi:hypothetical protein